MCGRKTLTRDMLSIIEELAVEDWEDPDNYFPSYNITPTQSTPVLFFSSKRLVKSMRWGLIPSWAKDTSIGAKLINARSETILEKPSFKNLVPRQRCIIIADGYYEWKKSSGKARPFYIRHQENLLLPMAGLWDTWKNPQGEYISTYTVITTGPAENISHIHNRMPVILENRNISLWIKIKDSSLQQALGLLKPLEGQLKSFEVSSYVNSPRNNSAQCIKPLKAGLNLGLF